MKRIRPAYVLISSSVILAVVAAIAFGPLLLPIWRAQLYEHRAGPPELQRLIERDDGPTAKGLGSNARIFPYESISLETGPCFGPCPIYVLTLYRDGRARLVTDGFSAEQRKTYTASISPLDYARVTQLVFLARAAAHEPHYAGNWTDDSEAIIRAESGGRTWQVSDYGGVSPPEVWALIEVLRSFRENIDWQASPAAG
jgi:hypothetical protein